MLWSRRLTTLTGLAFAVSLCGLAAVSIGNAQAADDDAGQILKSMSDYLAAQKTISLTFDSSLDEISRMLLFDAQTSGGLLLAVPREKSSDLLKSLVEQGEHGWEIGTVEKGSGIQVEA